MKKILVIIDMQNDFIYHELGSKEAEKAALNTVNKIETSNYDMILFTMDTHNEKDYCNTQEGKKLPFLHCVEHTPGWELYPKLTYFEKEFDYEIFFKSKFGSEELAQYLSGLAIENDIEIEFVGLCTDICVIVNVLFVKTYLPEIEISVDASCCAGTTIEKHNAALDVMESCQINVYNR